MQLQITDVGIARLQAAQGPVPLGLFRLGTGVNYTPLPTDTALHGTEVYQSNTTPYSITNPNVFKYGAILDTTVGDFGFGEIGLYTSDTDQLFALAVSPTLIEKLAVISGAAGNSIRIDIYLSIVGTDYDMWLDVADSNNPFRIAGLASVDNLPPSANAVPNTYIVEGATSQQMAFLAYTDRVGLWNLDVYQYANQATVSISGSTATSVTIPLSSWNSAYAPQYFGATVIEFSSGALYSICRNVSTVVVGASTVTLSFQTPVLILPTTGDTIIIFNRQISSTTTQNLPIATTTTLGAIKVGTTLTITADGTLNTNPGAYPVTSVNGLTGDVVLNATNVTGFATVAYTGRYSDLLGAPAAYTLPIASSTTLGGVKGDPSGNITIAGDGSLGISFSPVKTVNGTSPDASGNVAVTIPPQVGWVNPAALVSGEDVNARLTTGLFFAASDAIAQSLVNGPGTAANHTACTLEVLSFATTATGGPFLLQRWTDSTAVYYRKYTTSGATWSPWNQLANSTTGAIATTSTLGQIIVGSGLSVTSLGLLSTVLQTVNGQTGPNVSITAAGIGALASTTVGQTVASLATGTANALDISRLPFYQNTLGTWFFAGLWNASTNHLAQNYTGNSPLTFDNSTSLSANGVSTIDTTYNGKNPNVTPSPTYTASYIEGQVYVVTVAGTTSLDGNAVWNVGDLVVAVNNKWVRLSAPPGAATTAATGVVQVGTGLAVTTAGLLSVAGVTANSFANLAVGVVNYRTNPDGTIEYSGAVSIAAGTNTATVTLPAAFTTCIAVSACDSGNNAFPYGIAPATSTTLTVYTTPYWFDLSTGTTIARTTAIAFWRAVVK